MIEVADAVAYMVVFLVFVFIVNPVVYAISCDHDVDYKDGVLAPLILEFFLILACAVSALILFSINRVFGGN